jgi:ERCC4-type nuclease
MAEIHIDYREDALFKCLSNLLANDERVTLVQANLELGDVQIKHPAHLMTLIFERKTLADLAASIKDGRYKEQKYRILASSPPHHVTYMIEGSKNGAFPDDMYGLTTSVYQGVYMHTMYRDGVHVMFVENTMETAQWVCDVALKFTSNPSKFTSDETSSYVSSRKAKSRKIDNVTPQTCYIMQLCQIPGVSVKIAEALCAQFPSYRRLLQALADSATPLDVLCKIPLIGRKKAQTILEFVLKE